ncbi:otogelin-like [Acipenser oxyrinchus oxyrinchus]|uniref:Otogelin-like n=1 Tax=Acipenser oxyrinchus oxyrinchus TaxID=40147 RepID=A0AAD8CK01_ACIOX|nr:otogelin-like [Acipenser oxyrinchus oxyrinchus]
MKMKMGSATLTLLAVFFSSAWTASADGDVQDCRLSNGIVVEDGKELPLRCANCSCSRGQMSCFQTHECQGVCSVIGSQAIRTFDDSTFTIRSFCTYLLVKTDAFSVILNNGPCKEDPKTVCIDSVEFNFQGKIVITINSTGEVTSSKGDTVMPLHFDDLLTVRKVSSLFMEVATTIGVVVQYDIIGGRVYVILDQVYLGQTQGLCGTFNHNSNDDFTSANGLVEANPQYFVDSWKFRSSCPNLPPANPSGENRF